ncbi:Pentatricopeptide repeat-containing protein [Dendrobium catenatum]|uniref:Pentatricopeptide repeat-containing protein n=2 Tax=Dendrobium catenatum TaxID=906689 RepID=A0A2I0X1N7_9ASPA|nr:Pentatricopeptide repeat-containing protein [Dendrobium catenatum]
MSLHAKHLQKAENFPPSLFSSSTIPTLRGFPSANPLTARIPLLPRSHSPTSPLSLLPSHYLTTQTSPLWTHCHQFRNYTYFTNVFQWNSTLKARIDAGFFECALSLFSSMLAGGGRPDHFTFPLVARAVSALPGRSGLTKEIHSLGIRLGFSGDGYFRNSLIGLYGRCKDIVYARNMFDEMRDRDVVSWTTMISGYIQSGDILESFRLFHEMRTSGIEPNSVTLAVVIRAFKVEKIVDGGRQLHGFAIKRGFGSQELVQNSILTAYSKMDCFEEAEKLFHFMEERSFVSWNILMLAYFSAGDFFKVVEFFQRMMAELYPSPETLTLVISALSKCRKHRMGQQIHCYAVKRGQIDMVLQASFMDFYAQCADFASSFSLLEEVGKLNCSTPWIVMMWALVQSGQFIQVISLFQKMQNLGFEPNAEAMRCLVTAYTHLGALLLGKVIHGYLVRHQLSAESEAERLETSILNMYAKCGNITCARRCFDNMVYRDIVTWSSMMESYAIHGMGLEAIKLFHQMQEAGVSPNSITFLSLLSSCSHSGLLYEGCQVFTSMTENFGIKADLSHYTCMVDLLARAGKLTEALNLIHSMDVKPDWRIWGALLASCRVHGNIKIGECVAQRMFELEPDNVGYHIILSNMQAGGDQWAKAEGIWKNIKEIEFKGRPGWSCIEEKGGFSFFVAADYSHQRAEDIYETLKYLGRNVQEIKCL